MSELTLSTAWILQDESQDFQLDVGVTCSGPIDEGDSQVGLEFSSPDPDQVVLQVDGDVCFLQPAITESSLELESNCEFEVQLPASCDYLVAEFPVEAVPATSWIGAILLAAGIFVLAIRTIR